MMRPGRRLSWRRFPAPPPVMDLPVSGSSRFAPDDLTQKPCPPHLLLVFAAPFDPGDGAAHPKCWRLDPGQGWLFFGAQGTVTLDHRLRFTGTGARRNKMAVHNLRRFAGVA